MVRFFCTKCRYRFSPKNPKVLTPPKLCPYCGKDGSVITEQSVDSMIRSVDEMVDL